MRPWRRHRLFILGLLAWGLVGAKCFDATDSKDTAPTTIYVVRHTERPKGEDPELSTAGHQRAEILAQTLKSAQLVAIYATHFKRTQQTAAPTAAAQNLAVATWDAHDIAGITAHIMSHHQGKSVLVVAHSDTIENLLQTLGVKTAPPVAGYGQLFTVSINRASDKQHLPATATVAVGHFGD